MDDCNLDKLSVKPGRLNSKFDKNVTEYNTTLTSDVNKISIDALTSDTGASYRVLGSNEKKQVELLEGSTTSIKIEVTAEDGRTMKYYVIHAKRLSSKDATLSCLKINRGSLSPEFDSTVFSYSVLLACDVCVLMVTPTVPDVKNIVTVNNDKPGSEVCLNIGLTNIEIEVTSVDGSNKQMYTVEVVRKQIPRYVNISDSDKALLYECPISLNVLYQPISIKDSHPKHTFSGPLISEFTKTSKYDPLNGLMLPHDWKVVDMDIDKKLSSVAVSIPLSDGSISEICKFTDIGSLLEKCNVVIDVEDLSDKFKSTTAILPHSLQIRKWEKNLQQIYNEHDVNQMIKTGQEEIEKYFDSLPRPGFYKHYDEGESPLDCLEGAIYNYATAIKLKPKNASLHLQLGMLLEEKYFVEDMFGLTKESLNELPSLNNEAKEGAKLEEALAICQLRGVESTAPISLKLKAIDEEYHDLLNSGQSGKADQVMGLYAWFSKKMSQEGIAAQNVTDEESPLGQAYQKYLDALSLEEVKSVHNFHVGRLLVMQGEYEEAIKRLQIAINWNPKYQMARFYLGLAISLQHAGAGNRSEEAINYLLEAMDTLLTEHTKLSLTDDEPAKRQKLLAENLLRLNNVALLRGIIQLGKLLLSNPIKKSMSAEHVFYIASLLASQVLPLLARGDLFKQLEWILLDAHTYVLEIRTNAINSVETQIAQGCERLSGLIFHCTIPQNGQLQELQEITCQKLVSIYPRNSHALYLLGCAQMARYDNSQSGEAADRLLADAKSSFEASISLEGQPVIGSISEMVKGQEWFQKKIKEEDERKKAEVKKTNDKATGGKSGRGAPVTRGGGTATTGARGGVAGRGGTAVRGSTRGRTTVARGASTTAGQSGTVSKPATKTNAKPATSKGHVCEAVKPETKSTTVNPATQTPAEGSQQVSVNRKSHLPRLGLARALKSSGHIQDAKKYYDEVILMAPQVHDAYIENAEMLTKSDPLGAVDVFSQFPVPDEPSFDDAFIFGEIVRLLMKNEKYDDPRLGSNLVSYGRVLGLGALEKSVKILEEKFKFDILQTVYAGVNKKSVDDPDMQTFFKFKLWI